MLILSLKRVKCLPCDPPEREVRKAELGFFQIPSTVSSTDPAAHSCCTFVKHLGPERDGRLRYSVTRILQANHWFG